MLNSKGSLGYKAGFEFFVFEGAIYRAPYENPLDTRGLRQGARFECYGTTRESLPPFLRAGLCDEEGLPLEPTESEIDYGYRKYYGY